LGGREPGLHEQGGGPAGDEVEPGHHQQERCPQQERHAPLGGGEELGERVPGTRGRRGWFGQSIERWAAQLAGEGVDSFQRPMGSASEQEVQRFG